VEIAPKNIQSSDGTTNCLGIFNSSNYLIPMVLTERSKTGENSPKSAINYSIDEKIEVNLLFVKPFTHQINFHWCLKLVLILEYFCFV